MAWWSRILGQRPTEFERLRVEDEAERLLPFRITMTVDQKYTIVTEIRDSWGMLSRLPYVVVFESSDPAVARVSRKYVTGSGASVDIIAEAPGTAIVTATVPGDVGVTDMRPYEIEVTWPDAPEEEDDDDIS